jgi:hypothetical protein
VSGLIEVHRVAGFAHEIFRAMQRISNLPKRGYVSELRRRFGWTHSGLIRIG